MKKIVLAAVTIAATGIGAWSGLRASSPETPTLSNLMLENIEALAQDDEGNNDQWILCYSSSEVDPHFSYVDCASCTRITGWCGYGAYSRCKRN